MKRREFLKSTTALMGTVVLTGVPMAAKAQDPVSGGTLIWGHSETTQNLDMHQTGTASTGRLLQNVHESIVSADKDFNIIPNLAASFEQSEDGLVYTFSLRDDVMFHDGSRMTSADVKYSFERAMNPETGAVNFEVFNAVESIETPDDLTVIVTLGSVNAPFLSRLAENGAGVVMPEGSGDTQGEMPVGAGPFKFVRREFGNEVELERFDEYFGGPAYLDKVISREITEPTVRLTGLRTGELHMINDIPLDRWSEFEGNDDFQTVAWFPLNWDFVNFNHDFEPFKDPRVREAFDLMIDKEILMQGALWGQGQTSASPSFPTSASYNDMLEQRPQDFEKAKALLQEAGYGPGDLKVVFKVTTNYPYHVDSAQIMLEWFRAGGVDMTIEQLTWSDWLSQVWVDKDFQITMMNFFTLWEPDFLYYSLYHSTGGFNYRKISEPALDEMLEKARVTVDVAERMAVYKDVQQYINENTLDVILWFRNGTIGAQPNVMGLDTVVQPNGSEMNFHKVWLKDA